MLGAENAMRSLVEAIQDKDRDKAQVAYETVIAWLECSYPTVHPNWAPKDLEYVLNLFGMEFIYCDHSVWEKDEAA